MDMSMNGMGGSSSAPLNDTGVDFTNETQAFNFLQEMLDDSEFQIIGNQYARYFWFGIVVVIGITGIYNLTRKFILRQRLHAAAVNTPQPAKPRNVLIKTFATITALGREVSYPHFSPARTTSWLRIPPLGTILLILAYFGFIICLEFDQNNVPGAQHYTAIGVRAAWLAVAQVPLLILLVGKNNLIGLATGISYERLNVLHRWVARGLLLLATIHFGAQSYGWNQYGLMQLEWSTDTCPPTGIAAYALLLWLNLSTLAPFRHFSYEFFVIQHIITFFGFIIAIFFHLPSTALYSRIYIYVPVALYLIDRIVRTLLLAYHNFKPRQARLEALEGATRIRIHNNHLKSWKPGAHVLLSIHRFGILQSHPVTIASIPSSSHNDLVFILRTKKGFTDRLWKGACLTAPASTDEQKDQVETSGKTHHRVLIDGPYGGMNPDFAAFDTAVFISGSTGVTFALPQLLDIAHRASTSQKLPVRKIEFIWIVKKCAWVSWVSEELQSAFQQLRAVAIDVKINIYVTCDDTLTDSTEAKGNHAECGCECDQSQGPCCCAVDVDNIETVVITADPNVGEAKSHLGAKNPAISAYSVSRSNSEYVGPGLDAKRSLGPLATFHSGRPNLYSTLSQLAIQAEGEMGIGVCGPLALCASVRTSVATLSDERAVHKGSGAQGICLHVESVWY